MNPLMVGDLNPARRQTSGQKLGKDTWNSMLPPIDWISSPTDCFPPTTAEHLSAALVGHLPGPATFGAMRYTFTHRQGPKSYSACFQTTGA